jgi:hypothetical protein
MSSFSYNIVGLDVAEICQDVDTFNRKENAI